METKQSRSQEPQEPEMRAKYDFAGGERGRYAHLFLKTARAVVLAPDVAAVFPDADSVNEALRMLVKAVRQSVGADMSGNRKLKMKQWSLQALVCLLLSVTPLGLCEAKKQAPSTHPSKPAKRFVLVSSHATILVGRAALPLFKQCSRSGPGPISGYWTPSVSDVQQMERDAPGFFKTQKRAAPGIMVKDYRQYAGFLQQGRKMIYVNAFPAENARDYSQPGGLSWHSEAVVICDGGPAIYGVEYDPQTRQFRNLEFNGIA